MEALSRRRLLATLIVTATLCIALVGGEAGVNDLAEILRRALYETLQRGERFWASVLLLFPLLLVIGVSTIEEGSEPDDGVVSDRWVQCLQLAIASTLIGPALPSRFQSLFFLMVSVPWIAWLVAVFAQGGVRDEERFQRILGLVVALFAVAALVVTWAIRGPLLLAASQLVLALARVIMLARRRVALAAIATPLTNAGWNVRGLALPALFCVGFGTLYGCAVLVPMAGDTDDWAEAHVEGFRPEAALYLVSDNQFHLLDGEEYPERRSEIIGRWAPSKRPLLLDALSGITLRFFAKQFQTVSAELAQDVGVLPWAHLGDFSDISCKGEAKRLEEVVRDFHEHRKTLASLVPGNHDGYFLGNYKLAEDESWSEACAGRRQIRSSSISQFREVIQSATSQTQVSSGTFLSSLASIGKTCDREVIGIFFDTSEAPGRDRGVLSLLPAGVVGYISPGQFDWIDDALEARQPAGTAIYLIFMHHPFEELAIASQEGLLDLMDRLGIKLAAIVAAHKHHAARETIWSWRHGRIPQFIVGSTTDSPQEANLLELGVDGDSAIHVRMRRIFAVAPPARAADHPHSIPAERCGDLLSKPMWRCAKEPENTPGITDAISGAARENAELQSLLRCAAAGAEDAANEGILKRIERVAGSTAGRRDQLLCLSWAASVLFEQRGPATFQGLEAAIHNAINGPDRGKFYGLDEVKATTSFKTNLRCRAQDVDAAHPWYRFLRRGRGEGPGLF